jgi:hypothetical protein
MARGVPTIFLSGLVPALLLGISAFTPLFAQGIQGVPVLLNTSSSEPLSTESRLIRFSSEVLNPVLQMKAGFATEEAFGPGMIFDSFTISLKSDETVARVIATFDASGVVFAPPSSGSQASTDADSIAREPIPYPLLSPILNHQSAFSLEIALDPSLAGKSLELYFDLFSNQEGGRSQGWFADVVLVPEPHLVCIGVMAGMMLVAFRRR